MQLNRSKINLPINDSRPSGIHSVSVRYHPSRVARRLDSKSSNSFLTILGELCQTWGGGQIPIIPTEDGDIPIYYREVIKNSAIDNIESPPKVGQALSDESRFFQPSGNFVDQFIFSLFGYGAQENWVPVDSPELAESDPWFEIYAACMGILPKTPNRNLLYGNRLDPSLKFEDFLSIERPKTKGSIEDLIERMCQPGKMLPRWLTLFQLSSRDQRSEPLIPEPPVLPEAEDSSPMSRRLVIVVCSQSPNDLALLWNLVGASGGNQLRAVGIPSDELCWDEVVRLIESAIRNGRLSPRTEFVFTSSTHTPEELEKSLSAPDSSDYKLRFVSPSEVLSFGPTASQNRLDSVLFQEGAGVVIPSISGAFPEVYSKPLLNGSTLMRTTIEVDGWALPKNLRIVDHDRGIIDGKLHSWSAIDRRSNPMQFTVPSRLTLLRASTIRRNLTFRESEPGKAARLLVERMGGIREVSYLLHAPLLQLLDEMASKQGINWFKQRVGAAGAESIGDKLVAENIDDLPNVSFAKFKAAFNQKGKSTKYWLYWAEQKGLITKGTTIYCGHCGAKEWVAVNGLNLPTSCKGCGSRIEMPFSDHVNMSFTYKLSELMRRVYRNDAMGHVLAAHFFSIALGERKLTGWHPGLEFYKNGNANPIGETDVLLHSQQGQMIPVEVKRSAGGVTEGEIEKLDFMKDQLGANWSALAICGYAIELEAGILSDSIDTYEDGSYKRMVLTYDRLLDPSPVWIMQSDPFELTPLADDDIERREAKFLDFIFRSSQVQEQPYFEWSLLRSAEENDGIDDF